MKRPIRYVLYGVGGVAAVLVGVVGVVALTFDPNTLKPQIINLVKTEKQRTLRIDGDIKLSLFPSIGARIGKVSLSEHQSDQEFLRLNEARVSLQLWPLLSKRYVIDEIEVNGLHANLIRKPDGTLNIADLIKKDEKSSPVELEIDHIKLADADLMFDDQQQKRKTALKSIQLKTGEVTPKQVKDIDLATTVVNSAPTVNMAITLQGDANLDPEQGRFSFNDIQFGTKGDLDALKAMVLAVSGNVLIDQKAGSYQIENLKLDLDGRLQQDTLNAKLTAPRLNLTQAKVAGEAIELKAAIKGSKTVDANIKIDGLSGADQQVQAKQFVAQVEFKQAAQHVKATLQSPLNLAMTTLQLNLPQLKLQGEAAVPQAKGGKVAINLNGQAQASPKQVALKLAGVLDESKLNLDAGIDNLAKPFYRFDLALDQLNLDRYMAAPAGEKAPATQDKPGAGGNIDLSGLKNLNAQGKARIGALQYGEIKMNDVAVELKAGNGQVQLSPFSMNLFGGNLAGSASATTTASPHFVLSPKVTNIDVGKMLVAVAKNDKLEGRGNLQASLTTQGGSVEQLTRNLNGNLAAQLRDGAIKGINIGATLRQAKASMGQLSGEQVKPASATEKTDFAELLASFAIRNGVAHNEDLTAKSPLLRLAGMGDINLPDKTLDYLLKASIVGTSKGQEGRELDQLKGVTVPVRVKGSLLAPSYALDYRNMLQDTAKAKLNEQLDKHKADIQKKAGDTLTDQLQKLFKK
ncbi:AsmA protein [Chitinivorax tropicus]|uniref:AsmA protein n=1 Tax=Chitinivorax tropicus TaxID=714531 RepID=A0A840MUU2_9PROT|nr:AsmA family protein [Chitinivorax tropicus]MBB5020572.1 AsmA protein [Chitinivorax tropicus]